MQPIIQNKTFTLTRPRTRLNSTEQTTKPMKRIPQNPRKALPVQAISMSISIIIPEDTRRVRHLNQKDSNVSYMIISRLLK